MPEVGGQISDVGEKNQKIALKLCMAILQNRISIRGLHFSPLAVFRAKK